MNSWLQHVFSCSVVSNSEVENRVGRHSLLQGIFSTQGWNPGLPHCRQVLYHLNHQERPNYILNKQNQPLLLNTNNTIMCALYIRHYSFILRLSLHFSTVSCEMSMLVTICSFGLLFTQILGFFFLIFSVSNYIIIH